MFLEILVCLAIVDVALLILELFHGLLLEYLIPTFAFELLGNWKKQLINRGKWNAEEVLLTC